MEIEEFRVLDQDKKEFPKNAIVLLDGTELKCYPKADQPQVIKEDGMALDTTGEYFAVGRRKVKPKNEEKQEMESADVLRKYFLLRAVDFLNHAERILSDSRMFLAPVPISNGLAYTGTSGFRGPTLGVFIEWWLHYKGSSVEENGRKLLTVSFAGSPLSGMNTCSRVDSEGVSFKGSASSFGATWFTFMTINTRYAKAKKIYQSYSLYEVGDLLWPDTNEAVKEKAKTLAKVESLEGQIASLKRELDDKKTDETYKSFYKYFMSVNRDQLKILHKKYKEKKSETLKRLADINEKIRSFRRESGVEISSLEYRQKINVMKIERDDIDKELLRFEKELIDSLPKLDKYTRRIVSEYLRTR